MLARERGDQGVGCGEVEALVGGEYEEVKSENAGKVAKSGKEGVSLRQPVQDGQAESDSPDKQKMGMESARWRERVRRAGRRVVVLGGSQLDERFECRQGTKVVEPSFAKGEWWVRLVRR